MKTKKFSIYYLFTNSIMDLNKAQIIGRTTQEIELKQTPNGQSVTSFSVATNRNWMDNSGIKQEQVEFHNVVLWGKLAEIAHQYLKKGSRVFVEGRIQTRNWEAQDGTKRYKTEIVGENMIMLDNKSSDSDGQTYSTSSNSYESGNSSPAVQRTNPKIEEEISIDDIPF